MVEVTQADYATAKAANLVWASAIGGPSVSVIAAAIARIAALEEAATELERQDGHGEWSEAATAIRALKGPTDDPA